MKTRPAVVIPSQIVVLLFFIFTFFSSCSVFQKTIPDPYTDFTSDHLLNYRITQIRIIIPDSLLAYPGASFPVDVIAISSKQKELKTRGLANGFVNWNSYAVTVEGGIFNKGIITLNADPRKTGSHFKISIRAISKPGLRQELILPVTYKAKFIAHCKGQNGVDGVDGLSGEELLRLDTIRRKYVYNGRRGQNGTDGGTGHDGCIADVYVKAEIVEGKKMMNVLVINHCDNSHSVFRIDPDGGSLLVDVSGGDGGNGGNGGDGGPGVDGAGADFWVKPYPHYPTTVDDPKYYHNGYYYYVDLEMDSTKNPTGNGGNGGVGGNGGRAGMGGNGGVAIIHLDSSAVQWKNKIAVYNSGGKPGRVGTGGYAGPGGNSAYNMQSKKPGKTGYVGADGIKSSAGKPGETIWKVEDVVKEW